MTSPVPEPEGITVSVCWTSVKVAVTSSAASVVTVHPPVPAHAPLQPVNVESPIGVAVSVTMSPGW